MMAHYRCPLCGHQMDRNLVLFLDHTHQHIIDKIKEQHPEWVASDGLCKPCGEFFEKQLSGELSFANIGPAERRKRFFLGVLMTAVSLLFAIGMVSLELDRVWRFFLFFPVFGALLGFLQERQRTCFVLAEKGLRNLDSGAEQVGSASEARSLQLKGRKILLQSAGIALAVAFLFSVFP